MKFLPSMAPQSFGYVLTKLASETPRRSAKDDTILSSSSGAVDLSSMGLE
jgi:hypothetical protein